MNNLASVESAAMPTQSVIDYFLSRESTGTARTYGSAIKSFFVWSGKSYTDVTPFDALSYNTYLKEHYAESTTQRHISTLTRFFAFAKDCGIIQGNPFSVVKQQSIPNRVAEKFLTKKEIDKLLSALREAGEREYILGILLAATGMRISEAQRLSWCDFILMPDETIALNLLRKGNERQILPLRQDVFEVVQVYMDRPLDQADQSPLFLNPQGNRVSDVSLRTWVRETAKRAGISKKVSPHTLRHSFATHTLSGGASPRNVMAYLNHKSLATTQRYIHATDMKVGEFMPLNL